MIANAVFAVMFLTAVGLAVVGALAWDNLVHRQYLRGRDPHSVERKAGRWM